MHVLKKIVDLYVDSSLHVALSASVLCWVTGGYLDFEPPFYLVGAVFFGTVTGYNFIKYAPLAPDFISVHGPYLKGMQVFSAICFLLALFFLRDFSVTTVFWAGLIGLLVFFYVFPVQKIRGNIRNVRGAKVYVVALVWALCTVVLPLTESGKTGGISVLLEVLRRGLFILAITIPFEIKDLDLDRPGLYTIPQQFGIRGAKLLGYCSLLLFWLLGVVSGLEYLEGRWLSEGVLVLVSILLLYGAGRSRSRYYTGLLVESLPLLWVGLMRLL